MNQGQYESCPLNDAEKKQRLMALDQYLAKTAAPGLDRLKRLLEGYLGAAHAGSSEPAARKNV